MSMIRQIMSSNRTHVVAGAVIAYFGWQIWLGIAAPGKIVSDFPANARRVDLLITLPFTPERFHILHFQQHGRVSGARGNTVEVRGVQKQRLHEVARPFWVRRVESLPTGG
jgi:hypothetical protein